MFAFKEIDMLLRGLILLLVLIPLAARAADAPTTAPAEVDMISTVDLVPVDYRHKLVQQMGLAEENQQTWLKAIVATPEAHREAMAYLLVNMPENDLKKLKGEMLVKNVELAYKAREATAWGKAVPLEIFFNDVLPYFNVDETRDDWRQDYYDQFMPLVKDAKSATEAALILNKKVFPAVKVKYHPTKREKPNQSPYESAKIGYASCTGLSIILSDACRAVGVPARLAGTPLWVGTEGNHTWTEVWDKQWYFTGSAEPDKQLNKAWFVGNAAKADESAPEHRIYAVSFANTSTVFPEVWDDNQTVVHGEDVTGYYTGRQTLTIKVPADASIEVRHKGTLVAASSDASNDFTLPAGQEYAVTQIDRSGKTVGVKTIALPKDKGATLDLTGSAPN